MDVVALIPARGGSKGIPRKNLADVAGKPLLAWTLEAAQAARSVTRVVVSTDDAEIAEVAESLGAEVLDRPAALAADETPMLDVVRHALGELGAVDVLVLLQPTSPLRRAAHIDEAVELLEGSDADSVVSVVQVPHCFEPGSLMAVEGDRLARLGESAPRRQDKPALWARNGPAVLVLRAGSVGDDLYGGHCRPYVMGPRDSLDVDDAFDLELAGLLLASARTV
jgi:CMP-N,N'-diacetyllegionaminic acid synthase